MALQVPPPSRWQGEETGGVWSAQQTGSALSAAHQIAGTESANAAWKHVKAVLMDDGKPADLYDLLLQSGSENIEPMPTGWPALLKPKAPMMGKMPPMVLQRYNARQTVCFCGVFPEIRRAWASVDNSLFLWRYDKWNDVPLEYSSEEQAISAVGLVKPRQGVFPETVSFVLVVCTVTELSILGVCCGPGSGGDPLAELSIVQLSGYSISADGVTMCTVASTPAGRIFLGGADGHLYEIVYSSSDGWVTKRMSKRDHSRSFTTALLPAFVPALWQKPSALLEIAIDSDRHILYTRHQSSALQVFDLGADGKDASIKHVAGIQDLMTHAMTAIGGDIFRGRSPADKRGAQLLHIAAIRPSESEKLHAVAVTVDGRRVFLTTAPSLGYGSPASGRPHGLKALVARQAPPQPTGPARGSSASSKAPEASVALYHRTMLLISEIAQESRSKVLITARDMTIPLLGPAAVSSRTRGFRESVGDLDMLVPGETCYFQAIGGASTLTAIAEASAVDELAAQIVSPPPRFVLVSTAGVLEFEKRRPVEILQQMFEERSSSKLEQFFKSYGAAEVAGMCFLLINAPPADASAHVVQQAKGILDNANLTGVPQMRSSTGPENIPPNHGFDMGQALPVAEPDWSGAHKGLCMYIARLLHPIWEEPVVAPVGRDPALLGCRVPAVTLQAYEARLRTLEGFLKEYQQRRRGRTRFEGGSALSGMTYTDQQMSGSVLGGTPTGGQQPAKRPRLEEAARQEDQRVGEVRALVGRASEACFLLRTLSDHHMPRLVSRLDEPSRARLRPLKLRDWVCSSEGEALAAQLVSVLVTEHLSATEELAASLQGGCPAYFKETDRVFYQASGLLQRAEGVTSTSERHSLTKEALRLMMQVPLACDLGQVIPQLAYLRNFSGCIELPLRKAAALDPDNLASRNVPESREAKEKRFEMCYVHVMQVLKFLIVPGSAEGAAAAVERETRMSSQERAAAKNVLLQRAAQAEDPYFHEVLYNTLIDLRAVDELLSLETSRLPEHLRINGGLPSHPLSGSIGPLTQSQVYNLELLAKLYRRNGDHGQAAQVFAVLAGRKSGVADQAISLSQREEAYQEAVLQARAHGDPSLVEQFETRRDVVQMQQRVVTALEARLVGIQEGSNERSVLEDMLADLRDQPKELAQLYNDCAIPQRLWSLGIEMLALVGYDNRPYLCSLWDLALRQVWEAKRAEGGAGGSSNESSSSAALEECCVRAEGLLTRLPAAAARLAEAHVCTRLELMAAGTWPERGPASQDVGRVADVMLKACRKEDEVVRIYDELLRLPGGEGEGAELHLPVVRVRLLRALLGMLAALTQRLQGSQPALAFGPLQGGPAREVGRLMEACQRYAAEAGRLQPSAASAALVQDYNSLKARLESMRQGQ